MKPGIVKVVLISAILATASSASAIAQNEEAEEVEEQEIEEGFKALSDYLDAYPYNTDSEIHEQLADGNYKPFCDGFKTYGPSAAIAAKWLREAWWKRLRLSGEIICVMIDACDGVCEVQMDSWEEVKCEDWPPESERESAPATE